ncbi:MAG: helix-turn-helix transcriptional regulator [Bacteriovoracaceae bacterium]|jgi:transcriptional regulator with XRE-family HTH domain|nr:helix-turn-helix transcriptional regulator [Bacteriovoracaceae bacterium]
MAEFNNDKLEMFLASIRKYMQLRGPMSQKELAELAEVGVSTMSRFLSKKTTELNPQLIAKMVAKLNIPLYEIIDFVDEDYTDRFKRLVKFYKDDDGDENLDPTITEVSAGTRANRPMVDLASTGKGAEENHFEEDLEQSLGRPGGGTAQKKVSATFKSGGKTQTMSFAPEGKSKMDHIGDKIKKLSPRQKAYVVDFLNLDIEGKDLMVDLGNNLFRYFKQKGMDL